MSREQPLTITRFRPAKRNGPPGSHGKAAQLRRQGGLCAYCDCNLSLRHGSPSFATWDHVYPQAWGFGNEGWNLLLACRACNTRKGSSDPIAFILTLEPHVLARLPAIPRLERCDVDGVRNLLPLAGGLNESTIIALEIERLPASRTDAKGDGWADVRTRIVDAIDASGERAPLRRPLGIFITTQPNYVIDADRILALLKAPSLNGRPAIHHGRLVGEIIVRRREWASDEPFLSAKVLTIDDIIAPPPCHVLIAAEA